MKKKDFKKALEEAYGFKAPERKESFFRSLQKEEKKPDKAVPFWIKALKYSAVPVTAAAFMLIFTGFINTGSNKNEFVSERTMTNIVDNNEDDDDVYINTDKYKDTTTVATAVLDYKTDDNISPASAASSSEKSLYEDNFYIIYDDADSDILVITSQNETKITTSVSTLSSTSNAATAVTTIKTTITTKNNIELTVPTTQLTDPSIIVPITTSKSSVDDVNFATTAHTTSIQYVPDPPDYTQIPDIDIKKDYRIKPNVVYTASDNVISLSEILFNDEPMSPGTDDSGYSWEMSAANADEAVYAIVSKVYYTSVLGMPFIQADIRVLENLGEGSLNRGDELSVYIMGGYMPLSDFVAENKWFEKEIEGMTSDEIKNTTVLYDEINIDMIKNGSKLLFFLKNGQKNMPENVFVLYNPMDIFIRKEVVFNVIYTNIKNENINFTEKDLKKLKG